MARFLSLMALGAAAKVTSARRGWGNSKAFDNLVTFGDSYTDEGRLNYFINYGEGPPAGTLMPESSSTASGGYTWARFVAQDTGATLYDYAVSGATCSNDIIERDFSYIGQPFPDVMGYEVPAYLDDVSYVNESTGTNTLYTDRTAKNTVYALWIGTNDLGFGAFLSDSQAPGTTISTFVDCVWEVFDNIYSTGGRRFVLLNEAPLELTPMYAAPENNGILDNKYWTNKTSYNMTEYEQKILEYSTMVNTMFDYGVPFQLMIKNRWPGATFSIFNVHKLLKDIYANTASYLESPAADGYEYYYHCDGDDFTDCYTSDNDLDTFLWYDELHPSEKTDDIIAQHFIDVVNENSSYGVTYS